KAKQSRAQHDATSRSRIHQGKKEEKADTTGLLRESPRKDGKQKQSHTRLKQKRKTFAPKNLLFAKRVVQKHFLQRQKCSLFAKSILTFKIKWLLCKLDIIHLLFI
ncbi:MAG: hypothetical protein RR280_09945, partial [Bacteroidaceae bacterium]